MYLGSLHRTGTRKYSRRKYIIRSPIGICCSLQFPVYLERSTVCKLVIIAIFLILSHTQLLLLSFLIFENTRCENKRCVSRFYFTVISLHGDNCHTDAISFIYILLFYYLCVLLHILNSNKEIFKFLYLLLEFF
mgnify:CR=1 FL=1